MAQTKDSTIELIRKLLALSTSSNPHEAAAAAAKAQELLLKHNLDVSLVTETHDEVDDIERQDFPAGDGRWQGQLCNVIAKTHLCRIILIEANVEGRVNSRVTRKRYAMFGKPENLEVARYMYAYLQREIKRICPEGNKHYAAAFRLGAVHTIGQRLQEGMEQFKSASDQTRALIVVSDKALTDRIAIDFPALTRPTARHANLSAAGYAAGKEAGKSIPLHKGLSAQRGTTGQTLLG